MIKPITSPILLFLCLTQVCRAGFYESNHNIFELTAANFDEVVYNTNYTTIVEFYAPWCGHCKNLKPIYKKVGSASDGIFQTAAVNCDDQQNKALCAKFQIQGYPSLMVFRPPKYDPNDYSKNAAKSSMMKHASESYNGERSLTAIVDFVTSRIKNYVKRINNQEQLSKFISGRTKTNKNKVLLLTDKTKPSALIKSMAIDFMSDLEFAYATVTKQNKQFYEMLGLERESGKLPQIFVIDKTTDEDEIKFYEGKLDKYSLSGYLTEFGTPLEGPYSAREKIVEKLKNPKKSSKSSKKGQSKKKTSPDREHDEL